MYDNVYVKACCECQFAMTMRYEYRSIETKTWAIKVCDLHKKQLKENFFNDMEAKIA